MPDLLAQRLGTAGQRGLDLRCHRGGVLLFRAPTWLTGPALAWLTAHVPPLRVSFTAHTDPDAEEPREVWARARPDSTHVGR